MKKNNKSESKHPLNLWIENNCVFVGKLRIQMTTEQCEQIIAEFKNKKLIADTLLEMDNYKPLVRRYNSVYLTLRNWLKRNVDATDNPPAAAAGVSRRRNGWTCTHAEALAWLDSKKMNYDKLEEQFDIVKRDGEKPLWRKK